MIMVGLVYICYLLFDLSYHFIEKLIACIRTGRFMFEEKGTPIAATYFSILLLMEIIQTIKVYSEGQHVKIRIIMLVSLIAVVRKILMLDVTGNHPIDELAIAALILVLSIGYYLVTRSASTREKT